MKKYLLPAMAMTTFVAGMAVVPNTFAADPLDAKCSTEVINYDTFNTAFGADECTTIKLYGPVTLPSTYVNITNKTLTIDLNGNTITAASGKTALYPNGAGAKLTIVDGKGGGKVTSDASSTVWVGDGATLEIGANAEIVNTGSAANSAALVNKASTLTINPGATLISNHIGLSTDGDNSNTTINGGNITGDDFGIAVFGSNAVVDIKDGNITGKNQNALSGNGALTTNSTITISGGTLTSNTNAAIYNPQSGTLTMTGGTLNGKAGIVARQGTVEVKGGTINASGTGTITVGDAEAELPAGTALVVDNTEKYGGGADPAKATISGSVTIDATAENPVLAYDVDNNEGDTLTVEAGVDFIGTKPAADYLAAGLAVAPNGVVMTEAEAEAMAAEMNRPATSADDEANPNTADSIALYATIATVALLGLGATALMARKANR